MKQVCHLLRKMAKHRVRSKSTWFCPTCLCPSKCTPSQLVCPTIKPATVRVWMMSRLRLAQTQMLHLIPIHRPDSFSWSNTPGVDHHLSAQRGYVLCNTTRLDLPIIVLTIRILITHPSCQSKNVKSLLNCLRDMCKYVWIRLNTAKYVDGINIT